MEIRNPHNGNRNGTSARRGNIEPWASYLGGGVLTAIGISRKSFTGVAMAAAGSYLIYRAAMTQRAPHTIHTQKTFTIMRPVQEVYAFWRNFENLPRIMRHLENVRVLNGRYSHWTARGPVNSRMEWDAELIDERENEFLVWRSCAGADIENRGSVQFISALNGEATEISVAIEYLPPAGRLGAVFAKLFGEDPEQQIREDLRHFKALMEAGEIPTVDGQPHGRRSVWVRVVEKAYEEPRKPSTSEKTGEPKPAQNLA
jgi:uncharacterized membrane protein